MKNTGRFSQLLLPLLFAMTMTVIMLYPLYAYPSGSVGKEKEYMLSLAAASRSGAAYEASSSVINKKAKAPLKIVRYKEYKFSSGSIIRIPVYMPVK